MGSDREGEPAVAGHGHGDGGRAGAHRGAAECGRRLGGQEKSKGDEVAAELAIVVSARENALKRMEMLAQQATVSQEEVERARATLAASYNAYIEAERRAQQIVTPTSATS